MLNDIAYPLVLEATLLLGGLRTLADVPVLPDGVWYEAVEPEDGIEYQFAPGALQGATHLTCDILTAGTQSVVLELTLQQGADGPLFTCHFTMLNQCQGRLRLPTEAAGQNRWMYPREDARMKIVCGGARVDLAKVDRLRLTCLRKGNEAARWCMTPLQAVSSPPPRLTEPLLPVGPLLDELGQTTLLNWPGKTRSQAELIERLQAQAASADEHRWPESFSHFGGWRGRRFDSTSFFRTHHDGQRWWLVDPQGYAFWSTGLDCVRSSIETCATGMKTALNWSPEGQERFADACGLRNGELALDFLRCNFIRAFGPDDWHRQWAKLAMSHMRLFGFNTVANWSQWEVASAAGMPYVRPLTWPMPGPQAPRVFRDFPDVFDTAFAAEAANYAGQLEQTRDDPALIGYFLMNEPQWGFATQTPAEGMLYNIDGGPAREALAAFCRHRYGSEAALSKAWGEPMSFERLARGRWKSPIPEAARSDLEAFSTSMVEKLFTMLTDACRAVDGNHLNLGARYHAVPPEWAFRGMCSFDVFSVNGYRERIDRRLQAACETLGRPALIGEWHFGALDVGLPASGIGRVASQEDRGRAYRIYLEDAAAQPWCVGVHYFTLYDQSAMGRFDGENYNIGFMDVCHKPYQPLAEAARAAHERMYEVAVGREAPFDDAPVHLPRLFN